MNLTQCPYDGAQVEVETTPGASLLLRCVVCSAEWERHGAWTRRISEPDRDKLVAARRAVPVPPAGGWTAPLPMVPAEFDTLHRAASS